MGQGRGRHGKRGSIKWSEEFTQHVLLQRIIHICNIGSCNLQVCCKHFCNAEEEYPIPIVCRRKRFSKYFQVTQLSLLQKLQGFFFLQNWNSLGISVTYFGSISCPSGTRQPRNTPNKTTDCSDGVTNIGGRTLCLGLINSRMSLTKLTLPFAAALTQRNKRTKSLELLWSFPSRLLTLPRKTFLRFYKVQQELVFVIDFTWKPDKWCQG